MINLKIKKTKFEQALNVSRPAYPITDLCVEFEEHYVPDLGFKITFDADVSVTADEDGFIFTVTQIYMIYDGPEKQMINNPIQLETALQIQIADAIRDHVEEDKSEILHEAAEKEGLQEYLPAWEAA